MEEENESSLHLKQYRLRLSVIEKWQDGLQDMECGPRGTFPLILPWDNCSQVSKGHRNISVTCMSQAIVFTANGEEQSADEKLIQKQRQPPNVYRQHYVYIIQIISGMFLA